LREGAAQSDDTGIGERIKATFDPDGVFPSLTPWIPA
jgi:hypothetical protein